jgi:hypothetical protein
VVRPRQRGLCNFTNLDNKAEVDLSVITWTLLNLSLGFDPEGVGLTPTGKEIGGNMLLRKPCPAGPDIQFVTGALSPK